MDENKQEEIKKKEHSGIFREKSMERISSPEQLHDYIRVTTPAVWVVLIAIVLLLVGVVIWGIFGELEIHNAKGALETIAPFSLVTN